jgi:putative ABC transport system ATP-binding protein
MEPRIIAQLVDAGKEYDTPAGKVVALAPSNLEIRTHELLLLFGPSGSGKTTVLQLLGCLIKPAQGKVIVDGKDVSLQSEVELSRLRAEHIGFVFQQFNLLAPLTAAQDLSLALKIQGVLGGEIKMRVMEALAEVDMAAHANKLPKRMSGGQQQRVAIARALITRPELLLCDEPTASLDKENAARVMERLHQQARSGKAVVVVTHDPRLKGQADRIVEVRNGRIYAVTDPESMNL